VRGTHPHEQWASAKSKPRVSQALKGGPEAWAQEVLGGQTITFLVITIVILAAGVAAAHAVTD